MSLRQTCEVLLRLYPAEYQNRFAAEMLAVVEQRVAEQRGHGRFAFASCAVAESVSLLAGAAAEWGAKLSHRPTYMTALSTATPQERIQLNLRRMERAIANHDFPTARLCAEIDRREREELSRT